MQWHPVVPQFRSLCSANKIQNGPTARQAHCCEVVAAGRFFFVIVKRLFLQKLLVPCTVHAATVLRKIQRAERIPEIARNKMRGVACLPVRR
jgi:hypothetical protein